MRCKRYLRQEPPAKVLAAAVGQAQDKVGDAVLAHVGPRAVAAERAHLHVLVERFPERSLVVVPPDVPRLPRVQANAVGWQTVRWGFAVVRDRMLITNWEFRKIGSFFSQEKQECSHLVLRTDVPCLHECLPTLSVTK